MKIDYFILAEGLGHDAKGAVTAIGLNQNVFRARSLPTTTKRALCLNLVDTEDAPLVPGDDVAVTVHVFGPSGQTLAEVSQKVTLGEKRYSSLPGALLVPAEVVITIDEYGEHEFVAAVTVGEWSETVRLAFYVLESDRESPSHRRRTP